jgi:hypothetical protein
MSGDAGCESSIEAVLFSSVSELLPCDRYEKKK